MQTYQYQEIEKHFLSLLPTKNAKIDGKHSILENKKNLQENCIMSFFYSSKEPKGL